MAIDSDKWNAFGYDYIKMCVVGLDEYGSYYEYDDCIYIYSDYHEPCCQKCDFNFLGTKYVDYEYDVNDYDAYAEKVHGYGYDNGKRLYEYCGIHAYGYDFDYNSFLTVLDTQSEVRNTKKVKGAVILSWTQFTRLQHTSLLAC